MKEKAYYITASVLFLIVGLLHFIRAALGWEIVIAEVEIPIWFSWVAVVLVWYLAARGFGFISKNNKRY